MGPPERIRLEEVREHLRRSKGAAQPSQGLVDLLNGQAFDGSDASKGLFINLWVMLKDRANRNWREMNNRYFAGAGEITAWCAKAGLRHLVADGSVVAPARELHYRVSPSKFNEGGLRAALDGLRDRKFVDTHAIDSFAQELDATRDPWFGLMDDFARRHLFAPNWDVTPLGAQLNAEASEAPAFVPGDWGPSVCRCPKREWVTQLVARIDERAGVAFDFPVHVLEFTKVSGM
jgi:hypothetical protein